MPPEAEYHDQAPTGQSGHSDKGYRACLECRRKKTKCDMIQPVCGLCQRVGANCAFPTKRKQPEFRTPIRKWSQSSYKQRFDRLMNLLEDKVKDGHEDLQSILLANDSGPGNSNRSFTTFSTDTTDLTIKEDRLPPQDRLPQLPDIVAQNVVPQMANDDGANGSIASGFSLDLPKDLAEELIRIFFEKIQPWLPLLHRPRFNARYMAAPSNGLSRMDGYSLEDALLLAGMFSLAARFSNHTKLSHLTPSERGANFVSKARYLYDEARLTIEPSTLPYLQGCILLAFYMYTSGPCPRGWILTGVCVRMAYELGIHTMDADSEDGLLDPAKWSAEEELRRAWWLVWELDAFGSTISKRPYAIDRRRMVVKLPVSDDAWFSNTPVQSAVLRTKPAEAWKTLRDSENQDERAWFLVANYLLALSIDIAHSIREIPENEKQEVENAITCLALVLPRHFHLDQVVFSPLNSSRSNFVVSIHLMLMSARNGLLVYEASKSIDARSPTSTKSAVELATPYQELPRIISRWNPEYIALSHPFIACMMVPLHFGPSLPAYNDITNDGLLEDMAMLVLSHYAEYWQIGNILLQIAEIIKRGSSLNPQEMNLARRFAVYFPGKSTKSSPSLTVNLAQQQSASPFGKSIAPRGTAENSGVTKVMDDAQENTQMCDLVMNQSQSDPATVATSADMDYSNAWPSALDYFYDQETNIDFLNL